MESETDDELSISPGTPPEKESEPLPTTISHDVPEGGYGWINSFAGSIILFVGLGQINAYGVFQTLYVEEKFPATSPSVLALIGAVQGAFLFAPGVFAGKATAYFGTRAMSIFGSCVVVFSMFMTGLCKQVWQLFLAQGVLLGFGVSAMYFAWLSVPSQYFHKKRASAIAIVAAGSGVGGAVWPIVYHFLFKAVGFEHSMFIAAGICAFLLVIPNLLLRTRFDWQMPKRLIDWKSFKETSFMLLSTGYILLFISFYIPYVYIELFSLHIGLSSAISFYMLSIMSAGSAIGRLISGFFSDYVGRFNVLYASTLLAGIFVLALWLTANSLAQVIIFSILWGLFSGSCISLMVPTVAQISKLHDIPARSGLMQSFLSVPTLIGTPIAGAILGDRNPHYNDLIIFTGVVMIIGGLFVLGSRLSIRRNIIAKV